MFTNFFGKICGTGTVENSYGSTTLHIPGGTPIFGDIIPLKYRIDYRNQQIFRSLQIHVPNIGFNFNLSNFSLFASLGMGMYENPFDQNNGQRKTYLNTFCPFFVVKLL
jgi:hypothetical protein